MKTIFVCQTKLKKKSNIVSSLVLKKNDAETQYSINNQSGQCDINPYKNAVMDEFFSKLKMNETDSIITREIV
ncbi:hypothetical protein BpHYR1_004170 [Brachionus plicatilis]|uniref:Uncharacterized protein n=1 Tax=Brachionus plicatilis TaxID=10195 RepID=A0A3M7R6M6_BRAPC|nr:hypothetical protein BpHYR1_004170 [Brachionus plicatilis]